MRIRATCLLTAVCVLMFGCSREPALTVYCAAGLRPPVAELIETFSKREGVRVEAVYSGSGLLLAQIALAERGDVYIAGDEFFMQQAVDRGFIEKQATAAYFIPVIAVAKGNPKGITTLADLTRSDVKVGLGEAKSCAVGRSAAAMLQRAGLTAKVKPVVTTSTVNELGNDLEIGTLDAAILWDAVARFYPKKVDIIPISPEYREVVTVPVGVLKFTRRPALAETFMRLVSGDEGKRIFAKHGYTTSLEKEDVEK